MRRLFIMRKDLNMSTGKLAAQVGHCAEVYWLHLIEENRPVEKKVKEEYINGAIVKTICEARNLNHLLKARELALSLGLMENKDFGLINDKCLTELTPENEDGTTTTGIWFKPLDDEVAHTLSRKYQLYR